MTEQLIKCPKCGSNNYSNTKSCYSCKYSFSVKASDKATSINNRTAEVGKPKIGFLPVLCFLVSAFAVCIGVYYTVTYFDFVKFAPLIGATITTILFCSIGKILICLNKLMNN